MGTYKAFITVDFTEFKPDTYRGVLVLTDTGKERFNTGDFEADLRQAVKAASKIGRWVLMSQVDNYCMDANKNYGWLFKEGIFRLDDPDDTGLYNVSGDVEE